MNAAALLRCPLCGGTCQSLMSSLTTGLPECLGKAGHRFRVPANDNTPLPEIVCLIGWTKGCPYRSCERAGSCQAPVPANDNEPLP